MLQQYLFPKYQEKLKTELNYNNNNNNDLSNHFIRIDDIKINKDIYKDLDIIDNNIINILINKTHTFLGNTYLTNKLLSPTDCIQKLNYNQTSIKIINNDKEIYNLFKTKIKEISLLEYSLTSIFDEKYTKNNALNNIYFTDYLDKFNNNSHILSCYTLFNLHYPIYYILSPIILILLPIIIKKIFPNNFFNSNSALLKIIFIGLPNLNIFEIKNFKTLVTSILSILFFLYNIYSSIKMSLYTKTTYNHIKKQLLDLSTLFTVCNEIYNYKDIGKLLKFSKLPDINSLFPEFIKLNSITSNITNKITNKITIYGEIMILFKKIIANKEELIPYIKFIGFIDYLTSINTLIYEHSYSLVTYLDNKTQPHLEINNFTHPFLITPNIVLNSIAINNNDNTNKSNTSLITGPNASGKSTIIKSVLINILLAQSLGISLSSNMKFTPFKNISCYINTVDTVGSESLFETEVKNMSNYIKTVKTLKPNEFSFVIIDEILSGTNQTESVSISYAICKALDKFKNNISLITTHQTYLTKLEEENSCINYKMNIINTNSEKNKNIKTYKMVPGITDSFLGIEVLKQHDFNNEILLEADKIKGKIQNDNKIKSKLQ